MSLWHLPGEEWGYQLPVLMGASNIVDVCELSSERNLTLSITSLGSDMRFRVHVIVVLDTGLFKKILIVICRYNKFVLRGLAVGMLCVPMNKRLVIIRRDTGCSVSSESAGYAVVLSIVQRASQ